jgi:hypothetical protein
MLFAHDGSRMGQVSRHRARHLLQTGKAIKVCDDPLEIRFARPFRSKFDDPLSAREALKTEPSGDVRDWVIEGHAQGDSQYLRGIVNAWGKQTTLRKLILKKPTSTTTPDGAVAKTARAKELDTDV